MNEQLYNLGIDIGGTFIRTGFVNPNGKLIKFDKVSSQGLTINSLLDIIKTKISSLDSISQVKSISIGVPASISKDKKQILSATFIHALDKINIVDIIEKEMSIKVYLEKDVNFLLYRDIVHYKLQDQKCVCGIYFGTGIGNSIYLNSSFLTGKNGVAGELGHIPVYKNMQQCGCGNIGCLEALACGRKLHEIYKLKYSHKEFSAIFDDYDQDTELQEFVYGLSLAVSTIANIFDPDTILLGGGVISLSSFPRTKFEDYIYQSLRKPYPYDNINLMYTNDAQEIGVVGGGLYAWNQNLKTVS